MKLRNKKTGKVYTACCICFGESLEGLEKTNWKTLKEFCEDWEDYGPSKPLIKDEKIRKAVRAWYDAIDYRVDNLLCIKTSGNTRLEISDGSPKLIYISLFVDKGTLANIKDRTYYTIAELCGEEEE